MEHVRYGCLIQVIEVSSTNNFYRFTSRSSSGVFKSLAIISSKFYFIYQALPAKLCDIVILTTWEPRKCGIATYSDALRTALKSVCPPDSRVDIIAAKYRDESNDNFNSSVVKGAVRDLEFHDLIRAGKLVNSRQYHAILVQYEFGMLYGDAHTGELLTQNAGFSESDCLGA